MATLNQATVDLLLNQLVQIILDLDILAQEIPSFVKAPGPKVPAAYQQVSADIVSKYSLYLKAIQKAISKSTTVKPDIPLTFTTRKQFLIDATTVKNDIVSLVSALYFYRLINILPGVVKVELEKWIAINILPYAK